MVARNEPTDVWAYVDMRADDECWPYVGTISTNGYGAIRVSGKQRKAHRLAYELTYGHMSPDLHIDHLCRNRACCNPAHLELVTCRENLHRGVGVAAANHHKTHCINGHEFTPSNTEPRRHGGRRCRTCRRAEHGRWRARQKSA